MTITLSKFSLEHFKFKPKLCRLESGQWLLQWLCLSVGTLVPNSKPLVYLACPYTAKGVEDKNQIYKIETARFRAATRAAARLTEAGYVVFSPITHSHPMKYESGLLGTWDFWQSVDYTYLGLCNKVFVLAIPGWECSTGVTEEIKYAKQLGLEVEFIEA